MLMSLSTLWTALRSGSRTVASSWRQSITRPTFKSLLPMNVTTSAQGTSADNHQRAHIKWAQKTDEHEKREYNREEGEVDEDAIPIESRQEGRLTETTLGRLLGHRRHAQR